MLSVSVINESHLAFGYEIPYIFEMWLFVAYSEESLRHCSCKIDYRFKSIKMSFANTVEPIWIWLASHEFTRFSRIKHVIHNIHVYQLIFGFPPLIPVHFVCIFLDRCLPAPFFHWIRKLSWKAISMKKVNWTIDSADNM